jgi:hypothetical protein
MSYDSLFLSRACHGDLSVFGQIVYRCRMTPGQVADYCMVSPETVRRWIRTRKPNPAALKILAIKAGYLPWESWEDREMHNGYLFLPGQVTHAVFIHQINLEVKRQNPVLRQELEKFRSRP